MANRFILFLLLLAAATLVLFILSVSAGEPDYPLLLASAGCLGLTILIRIIFPAREPPPSQRFRLFKARRESESDYDTDDDSGAKHRP